MKQLRYVIMSVSVSGICLPSIAFGNFLAGGYPRHCNRQESWRTQNIGTKLNMITVFTVNNIIITVSETPDRVVFAISSSI